MAAARKSGADAVHPGYGFLAESADFAQAVLDAGLIWIGPPPQAIADLGAKTVARRLAVRVGAPLAAGLDETATSAESIEQFARQYGLPVIIKAIYGGGGRGMKVIRTLSEIPEAYESAVRESTAAFGRGECFVERFLERARHVETQCLADRAGNVAVISTRDCSLQRRNQKLVEEAPAPFLSDGQVTQLYGASKAILREAGYVNAGTCEFLIAPDGTISFNEVNTRLQVEHPVSELVTGLDLVREQLRIAAGGLIDYDDPEVRHHAVEFRINGEDPGRGFLPTPGVLERWRPPSGPGVRWDGGFVEGDVLPAEFDSLLGKLIIYGVDRTEALDAPAALDEFEVQGIATVLPFDREIVRHPAFTKGPPLGVHTRWIETEFKNDIAPYEGLLAAPDKPGPVSLVVEVGDRRLEVRIPRELAQPSPSVNAPLPTPPRRRPADSSFRPGGGPVADGAVTAPMQAKVVRVAVTEGQSVSRGDLLLVIEAMKMEQPLVAQRDGKVRDLAVSVDDGVHAGDVLCRVEGEEQT